jgi:hypothetical protein
MLTGIAAAHWLDGIAFCSSMNAVSAPDDLVRLCWSDGSPFSRSRRDLRDAVTAPRAEATACKR